MVIASAAIPVTDPYLIDRISAIAVLKGCQVLVVLNKCDLDPADDLYEIYSASAIPVLRASAVTGEGIAALHQAASRQAECADWQLRRGKIQPAERACTPF